MMVKIFNKELIEISPRSPLERVGGEEKSNECKPIYFLRSTIPISEESVQRALNVNPFLSSIY
jgi:hypothetical protein